MLKNHLLVQLLVRKDWTHRRIKNFRNQEEKNPGNNKKNWKKYKKLILLSKKQIPIEVFGLDALCGFKIIGDDKSYFKTFITQEMLKRGFLASNIVYVCIDHDERILKKYLSELDKIFAKIKKNFSNTKILRLLNNKVATKKFKRLN